MRVGKVTGHEYLVGLNLFEQVFYNVDVAFRQIAFLYSAGFIERQAQEMYILRLYTYVRACNRCFGLANHGFDFAYFGRVDIGHGALGVHAGMYVAAQIQIFLGIEAEHGRNLVHHQEVAHHILVAYGNVARGFVCHVYVVALIDEAFESAAHRNHVVVGVGREHNHTLGVGGGTLRARGVVGIGLAAGPAGNGVLQFVDYLYVYIVSRAIGGNEAAQTMVVVVLVGEFEDWFAGDSAEPHNSAAHLLGSPFAAGDHPGVRYAGEVVGCRQVKSDMGVLVHLQEAGRYGVSHRAFDGLFDHFRRVFAPCHAHHRVGRQQVGQAKSNCSCRAFVALVGILYHLVLFGAQKYQAAVRGSG